MPAFHYQALDPQGQTQNGVLEGDSERAVRQLMLLILNTTVSS